MNLGILAGVMIAGLLLLLPALAVGWGDSDTREITYLWLWLYLPLTGPLYLLVLAWVARRARRPRVWAVVLTPLLFGLFPIAVIAITLPGVAATWVAYLAFGALVRLPPPGGPTSG